MCCYPLQQAAYTGLEEDELVSEVVAFYGACMDERRRVDRNQLLAVLSEWASLLPLTNKGKEINPNPLDPLPL